MRRERRIIRRPVHVSALIGAKDRIETLGVEIDQPDLPTTRSKRGHRRVAHRGPEALRHRMTEDNEAFHQNASIFAATFAMNFSRLSGVERFIE